MSNKTIHTKEYNILIYLLRLKREERSLTQAQLAVLIGVDQTHVSKIENSERRLDFIELRNICIAMDIPLSDFIQELEEQLNQLDGRP